MCSRVDYFENIFNTVNSAILMLDENLKVPSHNRSFFNILRVDAANTIGTLLEEILPKNIPVDNFEIEHAFRSIGKKTMLPNARTIQQKNADTHRFFPVRLLRD